MGGSRTLKDRRVKNIQFEFGPLNIDTRVFFRDLFRFLVQNNYQLHIISPKGLIPLKQYDRQLEQFEVTKVLASLLDS